MGIASIWTGLGLRTSGPDHRAPCKLSNSGFGFGAILRVVVAAFGRRRCRFQKIYRVESRDYVC